MTDNSILTVYDYFHHCSSFFQGLNATLTEPVSSLGLRGCYNRELKPRLHPELKEPLKKLCEDPNTTVVILSGSDRTVLDDVFLFFQLPSSFLPLAYYAQGLKASHADIWRIQSVVGSRKWDVFPPYNEWMADNNA